MPSSFRSKGAEGFTLIEVTVAMTVLVIVLVLSGTLLFSMRSFAQKQQSFAEPRQTARRAIDYLSYYVRGASDMNFTHSETPAPNAIVAWYSSNDSGTVPVQATFDNVTNTSLAISGTDIITLAKPMVGSGPITILNWQGGANSANFDVDFAQGCMDDTANLKAFQQLMGCDPTCIGDPNCPSGLFMIVDSTGVWQYYMITNFHSSTCSNLTAVPPAPVFSTTDISPKNGMNPPGGFHTVDCGDDTKPCHIMGGIQFVTFRVANATDGTPRLEEFTSPARLFNSATDTTGANDPFTPLLDNVEDFQVAYIFDDGTIWNSSQQRLDAATYTGNVPSQGSINPYDAIHVRALRISVVARSARLLRTFLGGPGSKMPPVTAPENSAAAYTAGYYHYRLTATVMIQNRILGN